MMSTGRGAVFGRRRALLLLLLAASRCGSPPPPPPALELTIAAGGDQNPDASGHPAPVAVRLYQLSGTGSFERADVFALTEREVATLGAESLASEEILVAPGENQKVAHDIKSGAQFLGVAVLFRDIDQANWRATAALLPHGVTRLALRIAGTRAALVPG